MNGHSPGTTAIPWSSQNLHSRRRACPAASRAIKPHALDAGVTHSRTSTSVTAGGVMSRTLSTGGSISRRLRKQGTPSIGSLTRCTGTGSYPRARNSRNRAWEKSFGWRATPTNAKRFCARKSDERNHPDTETHSADRSQISSVLIAETGLRLQEHFAADRIPVGPRIGSRDVAHWDAAIGEAGHGRAFHA